MKIRRLAPLILTVALLWAGSIQAADIKKRTAIICVFDETRSLTSFQANTDGDGKADKVRSWFTQWLFADNESSRSSKIRFLWAPEDKSGPLKISSKDTHHVLVKLMSLTRDSVVASSSASDILTAVGWLFSINFKLEQVMATSVRSNAAGMKGQTVRLSCNFTNDTPEVEVPETGSGIG
jgi:hypothetical protein